MSSRSTPGGASTQPAPGGRESPADAGFTPIGVDVGTCQLVTVASADATPADAVAVAGGRVRDLYSEFTNATQRLARRPDHAECLGDVVARYWPRFRRHFRAAADVVLAEARRWPAPVVALEDLWHEHRPLVACRHGNVCPETWIPTAVHSIVAERVVDAGLPVVYVDPSETSRRCHECGARGALAAHTLRCETPACPVGRVDRDRSAALSIAQRARGG